MTAVHIVHIKCTVFYGEGKHWGIKMFTIIKNLL